MSIPTECSPEELVQRVRNASKGQLFELLWTVFAPLTFCHHLFSSHDLRDFVLQGGRSKANNLMDRDNPESIRAGDWVFVEQGNLSMFLAYMFPRIQVPFVLVTSGLYLNIWDHPTTWTGRNVPPSLKDAVESDKVLLWVTKNSSWISHPKVMGVPIGIYPFQLVEFANEFVSCRSRTMEVINPPCGRNGKYRQQLFACAQPRQSPAEYYANLAQSTACLSPTGWRADCFRHLECIGLGCVPITNRILDDENIELLLRDMYGDNIHFVDNDSLLNCVGQEFPEQAVDASLVFVQTWLQKIRARLSETGALSDTHQVWTRAMLCSPEGSHSEENVSQCSSKSELPTSESVECHEDVVHTLETSLQTSPM